MGNNVMSMFDVDVYPIHPKRDNYIKPANKS